MRRIDQPYQSTEQEHFKESASDYFDDSRVGQNYD